MPIEALLLALGAAFLHAVWNLALARAPDTHAAIAVVMLIGGAALLPLATLDWRLEAEALPWIGASSLAELLYFALLATAYARTDMSITYPIARGSAPVFVLAGGLLVLGIPVTGGQVVGVILAAAGIMLVRDLRGPGSGREVALALAIGITIATYTLLDRQGIAHASPLAYGGVVILVPGVVYALMVARRGGWQRLWAAASRAVVICGFLAGLAYAAVLAALAMAPPAAVAVVRESSIIMAAAMAALFLGERIGASRWAGSLVVVVGVAFVVLATG